MGGPITIGELGRRSKVVGAYLAAAASSFTAGVMLGVPALSIVGALVAAVGTGSQAVLAARAARLEREQETALFGRRLLVPIENVVSVDPTHVGIDAASENVLGGQRVPPYVARDIDESLSRAIAAGFHHGADAPVVVTGHIQDWKVTKPVRGR